MVRIFSRYSLSNMIEKTKRTLKSLGEPLSREILMNLNSVSGFSFGSSQSLQKVIVLHSNQQLIEKETKQLRNECIKFYKESKNWLTMYNNLNESLKVKSVSSNSFIKYEKEIGDVVNWAEIIESDLKNLVASRRENQQK